MTPAHAPPGPGLYARLLGYVRPFWHLLVLSSLGFVLHAASQVGFAELLGLVVDTVRAVGAGEETHDMRVLLPLGMLAAVAARGVGTFLGEYFLSMVGQSVVHALRTELFARLLDLPGSWHDVRPHGHLVSRITFTATQVTGAATKAIEVLVREGLTVIALTAWLLWMNWKLTLVFLAVAPVIGGVAMLASRRFRRLSGRIQGAMGDLTQVASEALAGERMVRSYGGQGQERTRFGRASERNRRQAMKMAATSAIATPIIQLLVASALALLVWLVLDPNLLAGMSAGDVVGFITAAGLIARPIRQLSAINAVVQRGLAAAEDIFEQFDASPEIDAGRIALDRARGEIRFDGVRYRYPGGDVPVLDGIDLHLPAGATVALVGRSGSGKSTLADLIPRFIEPEAGFITLDGVPLGDYTLADLRRQVAWVGQETALMNDTVAHNIAYGELAGSPRQAVREAARRAHALEFIEALPQGFDTVIGDAGVLLSGGQRQRLALARAILKNAPILILDEATSALDPESERLVQLALQEAMSERTTLVIAHRLSTIEEADRILVLEGGRIIEQGDHEALLAKQGAYARLRSPGWDSGAALLGEISSSAPVDDGPDLPDQGVQSGGLIQEVLEEGDTLPAFWRRRSWVSHLLAPLGWVTRAIAVRRRSNREAGPTDEGGVPVIVIGNITVGGTGKTPLVAWMVAWLRDRGWNPGVVCSGYRGRIHGAARVTGSDDPREVGDEAVWLAAVTGAPVVAGRDRCAALQQFAAGEVDIVVSDDGLQHHALERNLEIAVVDGARAFGNERCLPAGPLREPISTLDEVDLVLVNGPTHHPGLAARPGFHLIPTVAHALPGGGEVPLDLISGRTVHAVAGIGHPGRFFATLRGLGANVHAHAFPDHHDFAPEDLLFDSPGPCVMTEKDGIKVRRLLEQAALAGEMHLDQDREWWALQVRVEPDSEMLDALERMEQGLRLRGSNPGESVS